MLDGTGTVGADRLGISPTIPPRSYMHDSGVCQMNEIAAPKGRLTALEQALLEKPWVKARPEVRVKLLAQDQELYVFTPP